MYSASLQILYLHLRINFNNILNDSIRIIWPIIYSGYYYYLVYRENNQLRQPLHQLSYSTNAVPEQSPNKSICNAEQSGCSAITSKMFYKTQSKCSTQQKKKNIADENKQQTNHTQPLHPTASLDSHVTMPNGEYSKPGDQTGNRVDPDLVGPVIASPELTPVMVAEQQSGEIAVNMPQGIHFMNDADQTLAVLSLPQVSSDVISEQQRELVAANMSTHTQFLFFQLLVHI